MARAGRPLAVVAVLVLAACSSGHQTTQSSGTTLRPTAPSPPPRQRSSTTTVAPRYSFNDSVAPPEIMNTGTDYAAIVRSLGAYGAWLEAHHPDVGLISKIAAPTSRFERAMHHDVGILTRLKRRLYETQAGAPNVTVIDRRTDAVSLRYDEHLVSQTVVDEHGSITSTLRYEQPVTRYMIVLARLRDGRWTIAEIEEQHT